MQESVVDTHTIEWQFIDSIYIGGGEIRAMNAKRGDKVDMWLVAPATPLTLNGGNTGNCNKIGQLPYTNLSGAFQPGEVVTGGTSGHTAVVVADAGSVLTLMNASGSFQDAEQLTGGTSGATADAVGVIAVNVIVPAPLNDGGYDVDVAAALNANLANKADGSQPNKVTKAAPVPAIVKVDGEDTPDGYWSWDEITGDLTVAMGGAGEKLGFWNLYDAEIKLVKWVAGWQLWDLDAGSQAQEVKHVFQIPTKAKKILPHWIYRANFTKVVVGTFSATWGLDLGRQRTY